MCVIYMQGVKVVLTDLNAIKRHKVNEKIHTFTPFPFECFDCSP